MTDQATSSGRKVPPLHEFTFDTGITARLRKLSPFLRDDVDAQLRRDDKREGKLPEPPMVPGVEGKLEPNESDPDWLEARTRYERELRVRVQDKLLRIAIRRGVEVEIDEELMAELVADAQAEGIEFTEEDKKYFYITRVCVGSDSDLQDLYNALFTRSTPTKEAVEAIKATFQRPV